MVRSLTDGTFRDFRELCEPCEDACLSLVRDDRSGDGAQTTGALRLRNCVAAAIKLAMCALQYGAT